MLTRRTLGQRVRARREHLGLSQEALAAAAGVSRDSISRLERGRISPNLVTFGKIAETLNTSASALLAEQHSAELTELVYRLPDHDQHNVVVMLRALADHLS